MFKWICHLRATHQRREVSDDIPFTTIVRNKFIREAPASFSNCAITFLCGSELTVGTAAIQSENQNTKRIIGLWDGRSQMEVVESPKVN